VPHIRKLDTFSPSGPTQALLAPEATVGHWREAIAFFVADILDFQVERLP